MTNKAIPIYRPFIDKTEEDLVNDCMKSTWISSKGANINKFEEQIKKYIKADYCTTTSSGTTALHLSLIISNIEKDDFILVPNITFIATLNSIKYVGANPILIDVDIDTWQINLDLLEKFLSKNSKIINGVCIHNDTKKPIKAIIPVHVLGNMCDMNRLMEISKKWRL